MKANLEVKEEYIKQLEVQVRGLQTTLHDALLRAQEEEEKQPEGIPVEKEESSCVTYGQCLPVSESYALGCGMSKKDEEHAHSRKKNAAPPCHGDRLCLLLCGL